MLPTIVCCAPPFLSHARTRTHMQLQQPSEVDHAACVAYFQAKIRDANTKVESMRAEVRGVAAAKVQATKAKADAGVGIKAEAEVEAETAVKVEAKAEAEVEAETVVKVEAKAEADVEAEMVVKAEAKAEADVEAEMVVKVEIGAGTEEEAAESTTTARPITSADISRALDHVNHLRLKLDDLLEDWQCRRCVRQAQVGQFIFSFFHFSKTIAMQPMRSFV